MRNVKEPQSAVRRAAKSKHWSRGPCWGINTREEGAVESSDTIEIAGVSAQTNALEIERVELAIHSSDREDLDDREFLGLCDQ